MFLGLGLYPTFLAGWRSNRSYASIGALRGVAQTISYEVRLALILISFIVLFKSLSLDFFLLKKEQALVFLTLPLIAMWLISALAETNRTPFDFAEGERELVSGFNIEYGRAKFALIFIAEYGMILLFRLLRRVLILSNRLLPQT